MQLCKTCNGYGIRTSVGGSTEVLCEVCRGRGYKRSFADKVFIALISLAALAGAYFIGAKFSAEAFSPKAISPSLECGEVWVVSPGDRVDDLVKVCFPRVNVQRAKEHLRELNPHIKSLGVIHPGDKIFLKERSSE